MKAITKIFLFGTFLIATAACNSSKYHLKQENYDASIAKAIKQMRGASKKAKIKHLHTLADAFNEAQRRDLLAIKSLKQRKDAENWVRINGLYKSIMGRQDKVRPYEAHAKDFGIDIAESMRNFSDAEYDSRKKAAQFLYADAERLMVNARQGDKIAAREAVDKLERLNGLFDRYEDKDAMLEEAYFLGTENILIHLTNASRTIIPDAMEHHILDFGVENLNDRFNRYTYQDDPEIDFDYQININILELDVSPESERVNSYTDTKEIQDGFDYVLDDNGNVMKDTAGNDIKVDKFKTITATVKEIEQFKSLVLTGNVEFFDMQGNRVLSNRPISSEAVFQNTAATFTGERDALSSESLEKIGNEPLAFPTDRIMLQDAAELIRPIILRTIQGFKIG